MTGPGRASAEPPAAPRWADLRGWIPAAVAVLVVCLRLPYLLAPEGADEGGYLIVGGQWHAAASSLYSHYWVDRPPLLLTLFQLGSALGGLTALRLLGALAAAVTVLGVAAAAGLAGGRRAAAWAAVVAGALLASPLMGGVQVNGELLAAPFIALGIAAAVAALRSSAPARAGGLAFGVGACAAAALLVKQNMAEVAVFACTAWVVAHRSRRVDGGRLRLLFSGAVGGGLAATALVAAWTLAHGTSLLGVWDAMYPFRIRAAAVIAAHGGKPDMHRLESLLIALVVSGIPVVAVAFAWLVLRRRVRGPVAWGLLSTLAYSSASMLLGGGFWDHYLVELIVPVATTVGLLAATRPPLARRLGVLVAAVAVIAWGVGLVLPASRTGVAIGTAIGSVSQRNDTLVSAFGNAETVQSSGLHSPYPYLWTLPAQTLDPRLRLFERTLAGPHAPTWFVAWNRTAFRRMRLAHVNALVLRHYRPVARICGRTVFLHNGVVRPTPLPALRCSAPTLLAQVLHNVHHLVSPTSVGHSGA